MLGMKKAGTADLPLHRGKCPRWLFKRMGRLVGAISDVIIYEYGQAELLTRLSDPYFFQSLGCAVGFDWHSSGLTTTLTGALKEALDPEQHGIQVTGGKGKAATKAPSEIKTTPFNLKTKEMAGLQKSTRLSGKVDSNCVQDDYNLYHHSFIFSENGDWAVIQQGLNPNSKYARRYHWISDDIKEQGNYIEEPQSAICAQSKENEVLDLTSNQSEETRQISLDLVKDNPNHIKQFFSPKGQKTLLDYTGDRVELEMPPHHDIKSVDISKRSVKNLKKAYELQPEDYEELVALQGIGSKSLRALALISELVYGSQSSWKDPAKYAYAHGGKDGVPYPVNRDTYEKSVNNLKTALEKAEVGKKDKLKSIKRLKKLSSH